MNNTKKIPNLRGGNTHRYVPAWESEPVEAPAPVEEIKEYECPVAECGSHRQFRVFGPHPGGHYAKITCADCGRFIKWEGKPKAKVSRKGQAALLKKHSKGCCEICLRSESALPLPQVLEVHHVIPVAAGGSNDADNIRVVCTACHRLIHHQRTYLGHYETEEGVA